MGYRIVDQGGGRYAGLSSIVDTVVFYGYSRADLLSYFRGPGVDLGWGDGLLDLWIGARHAPSRPSIDAVDEMIAHAISTDEALAEVAEARPDDLAAVMTCLRGDGRDAR